MKIRIDADGWLGIERGGKWREQFCPRQQFSDRVDIAWCRCGDWCPLFGEPESAEWASEQILCVCDNKILEGTIEDKRAR